MIGIVCKLLTCIVMGFFGYVIISILMSDNLTNGEKLVSLAAFLLLETIFFFSIIVL